MPIRRRWSALPLALLLTVALTATPAGAVGDPWAGVPEPGAAWTPAELKRIDDLLRLELAELRDRMRSRQRESTAFVPAAARATNAHGILIAQLRLDARRRLAALGAGRPDPGPDPRLEGLWELLRDWSDLLALVDVLRDQDPLDEGRASRIEKLDDDLEFRVEEVQARIGLALVAQIAARRRDPGLIQAHEEAAGTEAGGEADAFPSTRLTELRDQLITLSMLSWARDARPRVGDAAARVVLDRVVHRLGLATIATADRVDPGALAVAPAEPVAAAVRRARNAVDTLLRVRAGLVATADPARRSFLLRQLAATKRDLGNQADRMLDLSNLALKADLERRLDELDRADPDDDDAQDEALGIIEELEDFTDLDGPDPATLRGPAPSYKVRESLARLFRGLEDGGEDAGTPVPAPEPPDQPAPGAAPPPEPVPAATLGPVPVPPLEPPPVGGPEAPETIAPKLWAPGADTPEGEAQQVTVLGGPSFLLPGKASTR